MIFFFKKHSSRLEEAEALVREAAARNGRKLPEGFKLDPVRVQTTVMDFVTAKVVLTECLLIAILVSGQ